MSDKNKQESPALPNNWMGQAPPDDSAPKVGPYTPQTSQSNNRGKDGTAN